jgi:hypothetical protein
MSKKEEKLIELAFHDLSHDEAERMTANLSDDAKKTVREYAQMREALREMRDVPEMQLSSERLRDAILRDGLKPANRRPMLSFLNLGPAFGVAATVALCIWYVNRPTPSVPVIAPSDVVARNEKQAEELFDMNPTLTRKTEPKATVAAVSAQPNVPVVPKPAPKSVLVARNEAPVVRTTARRKRASSSRSSGSLVAMNTKPMKDPAIMASVSREAGGPAAMSAIESAAMPTSEPVVLIESVPTQDGVNRAVEVQSTSNVLIGG